MLKVKINCEKKNDGTKNIYKIVSLTDSRAGMMWMQLKIDL